MPNSPPCDCVFFTLISSVAVAEPHDKVSSSIPAFVLSLVSTLTSASTDSPGAKFEISPFDSVTSQSLASIVAISVESRGTFPIFLIVIVCTELSLRSIPSRGLDSSSYSIEQKAPASTLTG